jgi:hypothetical protein
LIYLRQKLFEGFCCLQFLTEGPKKISVKRYVVNNAQKEENQELRGTTIEVKKLKICQTPLHYYGCTVHTV